MADKLSKGTQTKTTKLKRKTINGSVSKIRKLSEPEKSQEQLQSVFKSCRSETTNTDKPTSEPLVPDLGLYHNDIQSCAHHNCAFQSMQEKPSLRFDIRESHRNCISASVYEPASRLLVQPAYHGTNETRHVAHQSVQRPQGCQSSRITLTPVTLRPYHLSATHAGGSYKTLQPAPLSPDPPTGPPTLPKPPIKPPVPLYPPWPLIPWPTHPFVPLRPPSNLPKPPSPPEYMPPMDKLDE